MDQRYDDLTVESTRGLLPKGGTIARHPPGQPVRRARTVSRR